MVTQAQKRFPTLHRVNRAAARKLEQAAKAIWEAREILRQVTESADVSRQELDSAGAYVHTMVQLHGEITLLARRDMAENAAYWTDRDAAEAKPRLDPDLATTQPLEAIR